MRSFVTASMITERLCSPKRDGQELLPMLVEKLITASVPKEKIRKFRFPHGDQIYLHGSDGVLAVDEDFLHPHAPNGLSLWEMSTETPPRSKASSDFADAEKKLANAFPNISPSVTPAQVTYVCVTSAAFQDHEKWVSEKRGSSSWKAIRVVDAVTLAKWLEECPAIMLWFASEYGLPAEGLYDADQYLKELGIRFGAPLSQELVVAGRDEQAEALCKLVVQDNKTVHVWGESIDEAAAFVAACSLKNADTLADNPPLVLADSRANLTLLATHNMEMTLVPLDLEALALAESLKQPGWRMILPEVAAGNSRRKGEGVVLGRIRRGVIEQYLVEDRGLPEHEARRFARDSKGSLVALLWLVGSGPIGVPRWASRKDATTHASLILAGSWIGNNPDDTSVVERLSRKEYRNIETLLQSAMVPEGPWIHRGTEWLCVSREFVWARLASRITETMLGDFQEVVSKVIGEPDPSLDIDASERHMANILGKVRKYSSSLRKGLMDSVARLAIVRSDGQSWANQTVRGLLDPNHPEACRRWLSLVDVYSELAEAAPEVFLTCLDGFMREHAVSFFQEKDSTDMMFGPTSAHVYLLWALERLAWQHEHFPRVLRILAKLAEADPGGHTSNRPQNSLRTILLPWSPQHGESMDKATDAMDMLYNAAPDVAWAVGIGLLPTRFGSTWPTQRPQYRSATGKRKVTIREYWEFVRAVVEKMIVWADSDSDRLAGLIEAYPELRRGWEEVGELVTDALISIDKTDLSDDSRATIETVLRKIIARHRAYSDADWVLPASDIDLLEETRQSFMPFDLVLKHRHLFSWDPDEPSAPMNSHDEGWDEWLREKQDSAAKAIYKQDGLTGLLRLAELVDLPATVGQSMAVLQIEDQALLEFIEKSLSKIPSRYSLSPLLPCGRGYISSKYREGGDGWLETVLGLENLEWTPERHVNVALSIPPGPEVWARVQQWGSETDSLYWQNVEIPLSCIHHWPTVLEKWEEVQRPWSSIDLLADVVSGCRGDKGIQKPDADQIMSILEAALVAGPDAEPFRSKQQMMPYHVEKLFEYLDSLDPDTSRLAMLEWGWLRIIKDTKRGLRVLEHEVTSSPELFVDFLKVLYRADGDDTSEAPNENDKAKAEQAFHLFQKLHTIPGLNPDGTVNGVQLRAWVTRSRELAAEVGRLAVCDIQIGEILSYSPESPDSTWPCVEVREVIEEVQSQEIETGLYTGKLNQRGAFSRALGEGGRQEWDLAEKFKAYADKVRVRWPRSAAVLDSLTRSYEEDARRWDEQGKWHEYE